MTDCAHRFIMTEITANGRKPPLVEVFCPTCGQSLSVGIGLAPVNTPGRKWTSLLEINRMLERVLVP